MRSTIILSRRYKIQFTIPPRPFEVRVEQAPLLLEGAADAVAATGAAPVCVYVVMSPLGNGESVFAKVMFGSKITPANIDINSFFILFLFVIIVP
jgi:hypothetical protein